MNMTWTPRGANPETHHALVDGIPQWMYRPLRAWFAEEFTYVTRAGRKSWVERMEAYDLAARRSMAGDLSSYGAWTLFDGLGDSALDIIDCVVYDNADGGREDRNADLEMILVAGGSLWKVGQRDGLV